MSKFPPPPTLEALRRLLPELRVLSAGTRLFRIFSSLGPGGVSWDAFRLRGPGAARFDHHASPRSVQERGILYGAAEPHTCIAEVFQRSRRVTLRGRAPSLVAFALAADVRLLDLTGAWPTRAGASMAIHSGSRGIARSWSRAIYDAYPEVQGLLYSSSMDANRPCVALYERAAPALPADPVVLRALADPMLDELITTASERFGYAIAT